ncbi:MAG: arginase family protein [Sulfolobales archaeon]
MIEDLTEVLVEPGSILVRDPKDYRVRDLVIRDPRRCNSECICIVGYPWDWNTAGTPGARYAPLYIRRHLYGLNFNPHKNLCLCDLGDVKIAPGDQKISEERLARVVKRVSENCRNFIILGGDHSLTRVSMKILLEKYSRAGLIVFDSHLDLRKLSEGRSSGTYLRDLLEEFGERFKVFVVGYKDHSNPYYMIDYAREKGVSIIGIEDVKRRSDEIIEEILKTMKGSGIYISIDADSIDPSQCPGVNAVSPDGLYLRELVEILEKIIKRLAEYNIRILGFDVVEVVPDKDVNEICSRNIAYVVYRILTSLITS